MSSNCCNILNISRLIGGGREVCFDVARAICIVWVVCLLHLTTYIETSWIPGNVWSLLLDVTYASLGTFAFISGYFLKNKRMESLEDLKRFYISRLKRFWIPFFVSALSLWIIGAEVGKPWFTSPMNFILSILGLSMFKRPMPSTLWYMVMMVFFYLITPLWLYKRNYRSSLIKSVCLFLLLVVLYKVNWLDYRILVYAPMYFLGLCLPDSFSCFFRRNKYIVVIVTATLMGLLVMSPNIEGFALYYASAIIGYPLIISLSEILSSLAFVRNISGFISYSSMNMYLFHRQIYLFALFAFNISLFPNFHGATIPLWIAVLIVIPAIVIISFLLQRGYDILVSKASARK